MNENEIEDLLRKAPPVKTPANLAEKLKEQVRLPHPETARTLQFDSRPWSRRWLPAFSLAAFFTACVVVLGVQTSLVSELKRENESLRTAQNPPSAQGSGQPVQALTAPGPELERLRADHAELLQLRDEIAQLRALAQANAQLRAENQKLQSNNAVLQSRISLSASGSSLDDAVQKAKDQAQRAACVNNLKQIGLGMRIFAADHHDDFPTNYISMMADLNNPKVLHCPADTNRVVNTWEDVAAGSVSYPMVTPGADETQPDVVAAYCPIHHIYLLVDGSVQSLSPEGERAHIKVVNGLTRFR